MVTEMRCRRCCPVGPRSKICVSLFCIFRPAFVLSSLYITPSVLPRRGVGKGCGTAPAPTAVPLFFVPPGARHTPPELRADTHQAGFAFLLESVSSCCNRPLGYRLLPVLQGSRLYSVFSFQRASRSERSAVERLFRRIVPFVQKLRTTLSCLSELCSDAAAMALAQIPVSFAAQVRPRKQIRVIRLPAGVLESRYRLVSHFGCLVAVELERKVVLVRMPRQGSTDCPIVMEQLAGYYAAKNHKVVRLSGWRPRARHLSALRHPDEARHCVIHWCRRYFADFFEVPAKEPPESVQVPDWIRDIWRTGDVFWEGAAAVLAGLEGIDSECVLAVTRTLGTVARRWDCRMAKLELRARREGWFEADDYNLIGACDRRWKSCINYIPAYAMLPATIARLL